MKGPRAARALRHQPRARQEGISLIELLVGMAIMGVISAMLLTGWFALSKSWGFTTHSADARDSGRQAMQRLQREVRDAEKPPQGYLGTSSSGAPDAIIFRARAYWIALSTTFNNSGNAVAGWTGATPTPSPSRPHLVVYRLYDDKELWRFEDLDNDGRIDRSPGLYLDLSHEYPPEFNASEQTDGEGATLILKDVVNYGSAAPLFAYNTYDAAGVLHSDNALYNDDRQSIVAVQLRLLVDLDPARAPVFADLRGTAQLRNAR
ncbi:MAG: prepilin-type N-terminal cleavage/methylation domain-containing protein [Thermoleophilia bacterium]